MFFYYFIGTDVPGLLRYFAPIWREHLVLEYLLGLACENSILFLFYYETVYFFYETHIILF